MNKFARILYISAFSLGLVADTVKSAPPGWWSDPSAPVVEEGGTAEENYAPANLGQLKYMAKKAMRHLHDNLHEGEGGEIAGIIGEFEPQADVTYTQQKLNEIMEANYAPVNLGQLKRVAKAFYDRLEAAGYNPIENLKLRGFPDMWGPPHNWAGHYPWDPSTPREENYAPANIGQLKMVFSFDLSSFDTDLDGLPDAWEEEVANADPFDEIETIADLDPDGNLDGDSLTNFEEWQRGLDPMNATDAMGRFEIASGNEQTSEPSQSPSAPLIIQAVDYLNRPMVGKNIRLRVTDGLGAVRASGVGSFTNHIEVITDSAGKVSIECQASSLAGGVTDLIVEGSFAPSQKARFYSKGWLGVWSFDEGSGIVGADSSTFRRSAILSEATWVPGRVNSAIRLTASSESIVEIESSSKTFELGGGSFTGMVWIRTSQAGPARILGQGHYNGVSGFELKIGEGGTGRVSLGVGSILGENVRATTVEPFNDNQWHHVAFVVDRAVGEVRIYVDGTIRSVQKGNPPAGVSALSVEALSNHLPGSKEGLIFGWTLGSNYFDGELDEVRLYRGVLSGIEIANSATPAVDSEPDGMSDVWEQQIIDADPADSISDLNDVLPGDDFDGDGISNLNEYLAGTSPVDYFNGGQPSIVIEGGDGQTGAAGVLLAQPIRISVFDDSGRQLDNAPLNVLPSDSGATVGATSGSLSGTLKLRTSKDTRIYVKP